MNAAGYSNAPRILVVGDAILDRYVRGTTNRVSPEAPIPVVSAETTSDRPGGAANVAVGCAALGARATLVAFAGADADGDSLRTAVAQAGVAGQWLTATVRTIVKLRVVSRRQHMLRVDFEDRFDGEDHGALHRAFEALLPDHDVVALSDYGKGTLMHVAALIAAARAAGKPVLVDPKGGDFGRYADADLIKPNRAEFEAVAGPATSDADNAARAQAMCDTLGVGHVLLTRGENGMLLASGDGSCLDLPAEAVPLVDVTGAGDAALAGLAVGIGRGLDVPAAARLANRIAAVAVSRPGTVLVDANEAGLGTPETEEAATLVRIARLRAAGNRIVMTNGCFDLLHAGHLECLRRARSLGDRLVVAVNDDSSVRRLKGPGRPLVPLDQRVALLRALRYIDFVLAFGQDSPAALIRAVSPHVLVKGGDYAPKAVAGADHVRAAGGEVVIVPRVPGLSTTELCRRAVGTATGPPDDPASSPPPRPAIA